MPEPDVSPRPTGPQISLKVLLISLLAAGAAAGLLGRLFLNDLNVFRMVVGALTSLLPFVLAIGTILWIGFRARRKGLIAWGAMLLALPLLGFGVLTAVQFYAGSSPGNLGIVGTRRLIEQRLPQHIDAPWVWNELQRRLQAGQLSPQEVDAAVGKLTAYMSATRPQGWDQPLSWQRNFLSEASQAGLISQPAMIKLCDAFYGPAPVLQPLPRIREGESGVDLRVEYGSTWSDHSGLDLGLLWRVDRILLEGQPLEVRQLHQNGEQWWASYEGNLPAGDHQLVLEIDCAYVESEKLIGLDANDLPKSRWPKPVQQWKKTISAPLKVYTAEEPIVQLITDPARNPQRAGAIRIERFVVQPDRGDTRKIILRSEFTPPVAVPVSVDVSARWKGQTVPLGGLWTVSDEQGQRGGSFLTATVEALDPSVRQADIILTPNPRHIEHCPEVSEIWGKEMILRGVPLERLDLEAAETDPQP